MEISEKQKEQLAIETQKISENMDKIKHRIVVFSGKGGVGKTTVSVNLAYGLNGINKKSGILDADVTGPNVAKMLGLIKWGELDYLVPDLPPGTGDKILTMTQQMKPDLAIIVTTPQELSLIDSKKAVNMGKKMEIPNIGIIENMSGLICPECGHHIDLYGKGGGEKQANEMDVLFFGALPMNIDTIALADNGKPIILEKPDSDISIAMMKIVERIQNLFSN